MIGLSQAASYMGVIVHNTKAASQNNLACQHPNMCQQ